MVCSVRRGDCIVLLSFISSLRVSGSLIGSLAFCCRYVVASASFGRRHADESKGKKKVMSNRGFSQLGRIVDGGQPGKASLTVSFSHGVTFGLPPMACASSPAGSPTGPLPSSRPGTIAASYVRLLRPPLLLEPGRGISAGGGRSMSVFPFRHLGRCGAPRRARRPTRYAPVGHNTTASRSDEGEVSNPPSRHEDMVWMTEARGRRHRHG